MKVSYSEVALLVIGTSFTIACGSLGFYTYLKLIQVDQPQYNTPNDSQEAIELLEDGLRNGQEKLTECRAANNQNKTKFNNYVANTKATVSRSNNRVKSLEAQVLAERNAHNASIKKFNEYVDTLK